MRVLSPNQIRSPRLGFSAICVSLIRSILGAALVLVLLRCRRLQMEDANHQTELEINYHSEASSEKRKRDGKQRSKVWQHFTKIMKEDGSCDKCQCNHCHKPFTCSSRSGTTHLLRHITEGICPVLKNKERAVLISSYPRPMDTVLPWKFEQGIGQSSSQHCMDVEVELLPERIPDLGSQPLKATVDDYGGQSHLNPLPLRAKLPEQSGFKSQPKGEAWMNEFRTCVGKLVELTKGKIPVGSLQSLAANSPDYSLSAGLGCLNEMEDIPQSSEMYLDAVDILQDAGDRECFICLPPEPRRRWLQRVLHRRHPMRYNSNI